MMLDALLALAAVAVAPPAQPRCQPAADRANAALRVADGAAAKGDYRRADASLDTALAALGKSYATPQTIDDTGMHLVLAESHGRRGDAKLAARLKRRILLERLALCAIPATPGPIRGR